MKRLSTTKAELKKGIAYKQKGYNDKHQKDIENWKRNLKHQFNIQRDFKSWTDNSLINSYVDLFEGTFGTVN